MMDFSSARAVLPASDVARARSFYTDKLGLEPAEKMAEESGLLYRVAGSRFMLYETSVARTAKNTVLTVEVADLDDATTEMRGRGIEFEEYDLPGLTTENGVATIGNEQSAWFVDSEQNIIALSQRS